MSRVSASYAPLRSHRAENGAVQPLDGTGEDDVEDDDPRDDESYNPSWIYLMSINSFTFSYSLVVATLGVVILPSEAIRLFSDRHAMMLGVMLGCTGVTQLIGPAIGYLSDRSTSRFGRRRPLLVAGAVIACIGCVAMRVAHELIFPRCFIAALTASIGGLNISYACYTALLPDLVPSSHLGRASGTMATMSMLGALLGFGLFAFYLSIEHAYTIYCLVICLTVGLTCLVAHERSRRTAPAFSWSELIAAYSIDVTANSDFFWVFVTRVFYYMCISLQAFVLFMFRDVQQVDDPKRFASMLAMISQLSAACVAAPSGHLSDRYGRKPLVYCSCALMAAVYGGFALSPTIDVVLWLGVGYGIGNGMFLSVDYALACDTLPSLESAAQGLGVWGVSAFLGSTVGPLIAAPLLAYFGWTASPERYSSSGYMAINIAGAIYVLLAAVFLAFVNEKPRDADSRG